MLMDISKMIEIVVGYTLVILIIYLRYYNYIVDNIFACAIIYLWLRDNSHRGVRAVTRQT